MRRLGESKPRSIRLAVLLDKPERRRVDLEPDYFGFRPASNTVWVGYGLAAANGTGRKRPATFRGRRGFSEEGEKKAWQEIREAAGEVSRAVDFLMARVLRVS